MSSLEAVALAYAAHSGHPRPAGGLEKALRLRLSLWPAWARWAVALCAFALRWLFPLLLLGRARRFERLSSEECEALLTRLQCSRYLVLRAPLLTVKAAVLGACYSPDAL